MSFVRVERPRASVALVTLDRPERMNAMAFDVMVPLREALEDVGRMNDVRVVVLTGAGRAFCAGADLVDAGFPPNIDGLALPSIARRSMRRRWRSGNAWRATPRSTSRTSPTA